VPRDDGWVPTVTILGELCATLDDQERAEHLSELLRPYADRVAVVPGGLGCLAPVAHTLGRLAATLADRKDADEHLGRAVAVGRRMGAPVLVARSQCAQARALLDSGAAGDADRAAALLDEAEATARRLGMTPLLREITCVRGAR
jgi:hypothetical protein